MKLGSLRTRSRDGQLIVVDRAVKRAVAVPEISATLREALERWTEVEPLLRDVAEKLERNLLPEAFDLDFGEIHSPMPRSFHWADGSAYLSHMRLVRKARGADMPGDAEEVPLLYQGCGDYFLAPRDPIPLGNPDWGLDFEAEVAVILDDVPQGVSESSALHHIKLIMLCNDVSLRIIMKPELVRGFGFYQSKPPSSFSPVCVTPDELGEAWDGRKLSLPIISTLNGQEFGHPHAGHDLYFDFPKIIAHAAMTRPLTAGTIIGSGTVSNDNYREVGSSCLQERRTIETIDEGEPRTPFMTYGDKIKIEMFDPSGDSIFGAIDQEVISYQPRK